MRLSVLVLIATLVLIAVGIVVVIVLLLVLVWYASDLLMLMCAGALVSILLWHVAALVNNATGRRHSLLLTVVITPLVDRESVELPPAVTIAAQLLVGYTFGFIGVLVALPAAAVVMIVMEMVDVEGTLGHEVASHGRNPAGQAQAATERN